MDCSPEALLAASAGFRGIPPTLLQTVITDQYTVLELFDPLPCVVTIANGGGDTFNCYDVETVTTLKNGGTAFSGLWALGSSPFANGLGDTFDTYTVGPAGTLSAGTGFTGNWVYS